MDRNALRRRTAVALLLVLLFSAVSAAAETQRVTIRVNNAVLRDVFTLLTDISGANIVFDDSVVAVSDKDDGRITVQLADITVEDAVAMIAKVKGLGYLRQDNIYIIGTPERINKGFESVRSIKLRYVQADAAKQAVLLIIPEDRLRVDAASNSLIYTGSAIEAARVEQAVAALDVECRQIGLEAQVMAVNKGAAKRLGLEWRWSALPQIKQSETATGSDDATDREYPGVIQFGHDPDGRRYEFQFQAVLNAMLSDGDAKILSRPNVTTLDGSPARIMVGDRIPVLVERTESNRTTMTIEYVDAGIKLSYTPRINRDGVITAEVLTEVSTPTLVPEMKAYRITTREAQTRVRMKDGETIIIGGLIGSDESSQSSQIPWLGDLPIVGALFRHTSQTKNETEVLIMLKAKIME